MRNYKEIPLWAKISPEEWNDWKWQLDNRIMSVDDLSRVVNLTSKEIKEMKEWEKFLRIAITPYYATLIDPDDREDPCWKRAIATAKEIEVNKEDMEDPLHEDIDSPVPGITHRYPDRVLFIVTDQCGLYCRHCTRRRHAGETDKIMPENQIDMGMEYIKNTPQIRDVLLSGGDPLTLSTERLENIIKRIYEIPHVEIIRIGTAVPVTLPQRITPELIEMLKKYQPLYINTHFNHTKEITSVSREACEKLADAGFPLGNQSVLLKGVNDCPLIMKKLVHELVKIRVKPYYIYQCDLSQGIGHFRTSVSKGIEIIEYLRGHTTGLCVPQFIIDAPGGGGKIPLMPQYLISMNERKVILRNYEGVIATYTQPKSYCSVCPENCDYCKKYPYLDDKIGLTKFFNKDRIDLTLEPENLERRQRK
ncbi:MAG: lysine 2,3-aminomutase [Atribacterota bacterium]|nr:lysine 2,3-aminomutase [Atribacterota bacterium]